MFARSCVIDIMRVLVSCTRIRDIACILMRLHVLVIACVLLYGCGSSSDCTWMCMCVLKKDCNEYDVLPRQQMLQQLSPINTSLIYSIKTCLIKR